jgi:hypothetical protein
MAKAGTSAPTVPVRLYVNPPVQMMWQTSFDHLVRAGEHRNRYLEAD